MKTAMQELIEIINKRQEDDEAMPFMYNDKIIALSESMLEKEKKQIIDAYEVSHISMMTAEQYYNETFNTKER